MSLDIGGFPISQASTYLSLNSTGQNVLLYSGGIVNRKYQPCFIVNSNSSSPAWVYFTAEWVKIPFSSVILNTQSCFNTTNSRFTAPVAGSYYFYASVYCYCDNAGAGYYIHPVFAKNGSLSGGNPSGQPYYRIRGYGEGVAKYMDAQINQVYYLSAGDYIEHYIYSSHTVNRYYSGYSRFSGILLG